MALTLFEKQDNLIKRLMKKCDTDTRYGITIVAKNIWNIENTRDHDFALNVFVDGKKRSGYGLMKLIYDKYEVSEYFEIQCASQNLCVMRYMPSYLRTVIK